MWGKHLTGAIVLCHNIHMVSILKTHNLSKKYRDVFACDNVNVTINQGDIYGFVGLNGSGKTTFIRMITKLIYPTSGNFELFGGDPNFGRISSMVETPSIYLNLNAVDNIKAQCKIANVPIKDNPQRLLKLVGLDGVSSKKASKDFSLGMRQRLGIAMALVVEPKFMLLDEPTNGLDPEGIIEIRELLKHFNQEMGITILISSHILTELSKLATRYGFIHKGKLLQEVTSQEVHDSCVTNIFVECADPEKLLTKIPKGLPSQINTTPNGGKFVQIKGQESTLPQILQIANDNKIMVTNIQKTEQGLEDYFINLIKE